MEFTDKMVTAGSNAKHDLLLRLELGGTTREIEVHSKVEKKFGDAIRADVNQVLDEYQIQGAKVEVEDLGAWDFAILARTETAVKRALKKEEAAK
ncbi:citrate lyase subunit gamma [Acidaminococcus sp. NSJ-142]|jgi:citrate lyase acyl carrier protein|uniref:citrate lyase ACP n=1 Tax=Acidaminococcus TaxID=904 RepID=UPI000E537523|nr:MULTISPECIES: citrate lyase subunit gamma [Acidaminococcus]MCD2435702.1 citrate lyase subunit gamma [Acidaminococcus hominis]MCH4096645.1 citrate lyase subunit gamma [Acidaminococcus provencensis]RHK02616.1 citrate lyase subunit gamma [Acidaminococcus sp. AM05-11]